MFRRRTRGRSAADRPGPAVSPLPATWVGYADQLTDVAQQVAADIDADPDFGVDRLGDGRYELSLFDDVRALVGDVAIAGMVERLELAAGVDTVEWVEREVVHVTGPIGAGQLAAWVVADLAAHADPHEFDR